MEQKQRLVRLNETEWEAGYSAGMQGLDLKPPPETDGLSYWSGYIEGKAERSNLRKTRPYKLRKLS